MNWPNRLTMSRLALTVLFVVALSERLPFGDTTALCLFLVASATDYLDGHLARRLGMTTDFGRLMDPLVDKILVTAAFIGLVERELLPAWVVIVIVSREFLITGLRLLAASKGRVLAAEKLGKHKTAWQLGTIIWFLLLLAAQEHRLLLASPWADLAGRCALGITVALTLYSGLGYFWKHRDLVRTA